ncbi:hypothetical protein [Bacteroides acidifaciens]|uniref:hypothetical protein n=1 Tax=Bacteroides acidifaciens TaxID=85831 RepID=UPI0024331959|nr:hypothetical protein [Bacteroides acidifaciens]
MKRFASHYLLIPDIGFIKQQVVEINDEGIVQNIFPLTEEIESVEWMPGVIVLFPVSRMEEIENTGMNLKNIPVFQLNLPVAVNQPSHCLGKFLDEFQRRGEALLPYLFYPFDFISMQPVDGTRHRLLR